MKNRHPSRREALGDKVDRLTDEVKVLRESVDELKTALEWALRNARLTVQFDEMAKPSLASPPPLEMFEIGDTVTFDCRGEAFFGEIVELNDGENVAIVQLIPSNTFVPMSQDELSRVDDDPLSFRVDVPISELGTKETDQSPAPVPGRLF